MVDVSNILSSTALDSTALDPTALDSTALDPTALDSTDLSSFGNNFDPFSQVEEISLIHLRLMKRSRRKCITIVEGLEEKYQKKLLSFIKTKCCCGGSVKKDDTFGKVVIFQGDHRSTVKKYLIKKKIRSENKIKEHG